MPIRPIVLSLGALLFIAAPPATAQTARSHLGPHLSYQVDAEWVGLGAQLGVPVARQLEFYPSFDIYFPDGGSAWGVNFDLKYRVTNRTSNWLYLGGGLNFTGSKPNRGDTHTTARANLLMGIESLRGPVHPFAEVRAMLGSGSTAQLAAGINFTIGR